MTAEPVTERGAEDGTDAFASEDTTTSTSPSLRELPNGVLFWDPTQPTEPLGASLLREPTLAREMGQDDPSLAFLPAEESTSDDLPTNSRSSVPWSPSIWFYPDGRTSNARWTLISEDGYQIDVTLRGWVGSVQVGPVQLQPMLESELDGVESDNTAVAADRRPAIDL